MSGLCKESKDKEKHDHEKAIKCKDDGKKYYKCKKCKTCVRTGCPAIKAGSIIEIDESMCTGCSVCYQVCPFESIVKY